MKQIVQKRINEIYDLTCLLRRWGGVGCGCGCGGKALGRDVSGEKSGEKCQAMGTQASWLLEAFNQTDKVDGIKRRSLRTSGHHNWQEPTRREYRLLHCEGLPSLKSTK